MRRRGLLKKREKLNKGAKIFMNDPEIIYERIQNAKAKANRQDKIFFVAVSKNHTVEEMKEAEKISWIDFFGENRVQEAESKKILYGTEKKIPWRLIGHLQANKARKAVELFDFIDSVDSSELAMRLGRIAGELNKTLPVLIEINTSGEASKTGADPKNFSGIIDSVMNEKNLRLEGFMTVGPITESEKEIRKAFELLRSIRDSSRKITGLDLNILSMGMSDDFELAILEGSTMIRIGTLLFGARDYSRH